MTAAEARARWVANNPEKALKVNRQARLRRKEKVDDYKASKGCEDCGNADPRVLDLHHRDGSDKEGEIASMKVRVGWKRLEEEMKKCDVLCANCHRIRHAEENALRRADIQMTTGVYFRAS